MPVFALYIGYPQPGCLDLSRLGDDGKGALQSAYRRPLCLVLPYCRVLFWCSFRYSPGVIPSIFLNRRMKFG